jgi:beta-aspartyl-dipeptidase (metallo-type)
MGGSEKTLAPIEAILASSDVPINKLLPTHVNRTEALFEAAMAYATKGGYIDITSGISPRKGARRAVKPSQAIKMALDSGIALDRLLMSSDGQGSQPEFNAEGQLVGISVAGFESLLGEVRDLVQEEGLSFSEAIQPVTSNVARFLGLQSGMLEAGHVADMLVLNADLQLQMVFAKGQCMVKAGKACMKGTFE